MTDGKHLRCPYCGHPVTVWADGIDGRTVCGNCCAEWDSQGAPLVLPQTKTIAERHHAMRPQEPQTS